jgi:hypothetical protein
MKHVRLPSGLRRSSKRSYKDLDWQRVIDHIAAEIWIVTNWLGTLVCSRRARQRRITAGLCRRDPIVFPAAPCVAAYRVDEIALNPRCAAVKADPDLGDLSLPGPRRNLLYSQKRKFQIHDSANKQSHRIPRRSWNLRGPLLRRKRKFTAAGGTSEKCHHRKSVDSSITSSAHSCSTMHLGFVSKRPVQFSSSASPNMSADRDTIAFWRLFLG